MYLALVEFGAPLVGMTENDFREEGYFYQMGIPPVRVDILMGIPGVVFDEAWQRRVTVDFDGLPISFISRLDLIQAKLASGRPQDLIDAESLLRHDKNLQSAAMQNEVLETQRNLDPGDCENLWSSNQSECLQCRPYAHV